MDPVPDPDLAIIDPHHHLYVKNHYGDGTPYLLPEFQADLGSGHRIEATVYVESGTLRRPQGSENERSLGEIEFGAIIGQIAESGAFGPTRVALGIVGHVDLLTGADIDEALLAAKAAGRGRLKAIRCSTTWDADPALSPGARAFAPRGLMADPQFREGVAALARHGLAYDAWQFYPQLGELGALAGALPDVSVICGHCGGLVGNGVYAGPDNFDRWRAHVRELALRPNVVMKLGGLANERTGFGFKGRAEPMTEAGLVALWGPYIETCIEAFGADRCMFESNFPVDRIAADYRTLWTVFKRIAAGCSPGEKAALFRGTARRVYALDEGQS